MAIVYPTQQVPSLKQSVSLAISTAADGLGDVLDTKGLTLTGVALSSVWDSAYLSFRVGNSTSAMYTLMNSTNSQFIVTATSSQVHYISPDIFAGFQYIQPVSDGSTGAVAQTTATSLTAFLAPIHTFL
jgi:hypothetical protein